MTTDIYYTVEIEEEDDGRWVGVIMLNGDAKHSVFGRSRQEILDNAQTWKNAHVTRRPVEVVEL